MDVVSIYNDKGGVAKTTISLEVASAMAVSGKRVLLVDNDPQRCLSKRLTTDFLSVRDGIDQVYKGTASITDVICDTYINDLFIVPSGLRLKDFYNRSDVEIRERVADMIEFMRTDEEFLNLFDIVIFDNAPTQDGVALYCTLNSDRIVIPVVPDDLSWDALIRAYTLIKEQSQNFMDKYIVVVPSMVKNRAVHKNYIKALEEKYNGLNENTIVSGSRIADRAEIPESIDLKHNLFISHASSEGAQQFKNLCIDIFPWLEKEDFFKKMNSVAEERKREIRENFKKMVEKRRCASKAQNNVSTEKEKVAANG